MGHKILVTTIRRQEPDIGLYVLALIAIAIRLHEEEARRTDSPEEASGGEP